MVSKNTDQTKFFLLNTYFWNWNIFKLVCQTLSQENLTVPVYISGHQTIEDANSNEIFTRQITFSLSDLSGFITLENCGGWLESKIASTSVVSLLPKRYIVPTIDLMSLFVDAIWGFSNNASSSIIVANTYLKMKI